MLKIENLSVKIEDRLVLQNLNLNIGPGQIHYLLGPNGAGKSSLSFALLGHPDYEIKRGKIIFNKKIINKLSPEERARMGLFLAFQNPIEFEGVNVFSFLKEAARNITDKEDLETAEILKKVISCLRKLNLSEATLERYLNIGFSGGEKKKMELVQIALFLSFLPKSKKMKLVILDEIDSGLDVDGIKIVSRVIKNLHREGKTSFLVISHLSKIINYLKGDKVHVLKDGKIVKSGNWNLIKKIEKYGFQEI